MTDVGTLVPRYLAERGLTFEGEVLRKRTRGLSVTSWLDPTRVGNGGSVVMARLETRHVDQAAGEERLPPELYPIRVEEVRFGVIPQPVEVLLMMAEGELPRSWFWSGGASLQARVGALD